MNLSGSDANPPAWAEAILCLFLRSEDRDTVSGDLLEEYREAVQAGGDRPAADRAYLRQAAGFLWRATWMWAVLLALLTLGRFALDVFVRPASFHMRSVVDTYLHVAVFLAIGFGAAWRRRSVHADAGPGGPERGVERGLERLSDAVAAVLSTQIMANLMIFAGNLVFLGIWHDTQTLTAIEQSGGIGEVFFLPVVVTAPAVLLSILGGTAALILPRPR